MHLVGEEAGIGEGHSLVLKLVLVNAHFVLLLLYLLYTYKMCVLNILLTFNLGATRPCVREKFGGQGRGCLSCAF